MATGAAARRRSGVRRQPLNVAAELIDLVHGTDVAVSQGGGLAVEEAPVEAQATEQAAVAVDDPDALGVEGNHREGEQDLDGRRD